MVRPYEDSCFNDYDFIYWCDRYVDTVSTQLPVGGIRFVRAFDFQPVYDSKDWKVLQDNSIAEVFLLTVH